MNSPLRAAPAEDTGRPAIDWRAAEYLDGDALDREFRRVSAVCHECRRCEGLCDSFPRLFELIDDHAGSAPDKLASGDFASVVDACTLCDMCYPACPYTPPHIHAVDFPNLMARYRAGQRARGQGSGFFAEALGQTDRNGRFLGLLAPLANWAARRGNRLTRPLLEAVAGIHREADLPRFHARRFTHRAAAPSAIDRAAPAAGRKAVLYATCFVEYNNPAIGLAAQAVLAKNGVETAICYPACCGMPQFERGDIAGLSARARRIAAELGGWIDKGYDVVSLMPSCTLMLQTLWPLYASDDPAVKRLAGNASDIVDYVLAIARDEGLAEGLAPLPGGVALHHACHARARGVGRKSAALLRLIPASDVLVTEGCSGHGGTWGVMKENFPAGMKMGERVARRMAEGGRRHLAAECPLAGDHIAQGLERIGETAPGAVRARHPIELLAMSYGIG